MKKAADNDSNIKRIAIIGAGISGLTLADTIASISKENGKQVLIDIFESASQIGGRIKSETLNIDQNNSYVFERGAEGVAIRDEDTLNYITNLNLEIEKPAPLPFAIYKNRTNYPVSPALLRRFPHNIKAIFNSPLLSISDKTIACIKATFDNFFPNKSHSSESLLNLLTKRFGKGAAKKLFSPIYSGIYGGDAAALSAEVLRSSTNDKGKGLQIVKIKGGMDKLLEALLKRSEAKLYLNSAIKEISEESGRYLIKNNNELYDAVVVALTSDNAAKLLCYHEKLSKYLSEINYASAVTISFLFPTLTLPEITGTLIPEHELPEELSEIKGISIIHNKWPTLTGKSLLRVFIRQKEPIDQSRLTKTAISALKYIFNINQEPEESFLDYWQSGLQVKNADNNRCAEQITNELNKIKGLYIPKGCYSGSGIYDCIVSARETGREVLAAYFNRTT